MISGLELAGALIAACLLAYLSAALLKPEWFE
jgi:K+-transporting ATPase KdpF subunit